MNLWQVWWVWIAGGFLIGIVEVAVPGFIFLGFAGGAMVTGALLGLGVLTQASLPALLAVFAVASLAVWLGLRAAVGRKPGQVKIWDRDINDNP
jgi:membrane protein implicated in regulation of membrane protease activity